MDMKSIEVRGMKEDMGGGWKWEGRGERKVEEKEEVFSAV